MGDISPVSTANVLSKRPGIMLVRPSLHKETPDNAETFKRWTVMHFRDLLNCHAPSLSSSGISRTLRYTNLDGDLLYTIHSDDVAIWKTQAYYDVSRRLDLENTRTVEKGEELVLRAGCEYTEGSMVWDICNAEFVILSASEAINGEGVESYHDFPLALLSPAGAKPTAPPCSLVTLTFTSSTIEEEPPKHLTLFRDHVVTHVVSVLEDQAHGRVYTTVYRHLPDSQPDLHPLIVEGKDGNGSWVVCVFVQASLVGEKQKNLEVRVEEDLQRLKSEQNTVGDAWNISVGIWSGEIFMS